MIWVFGDSFFEADPSNWCSWPATENLAHRATSLDWLYATYSRMESRIQPGDHVIIGLTTQARTWFLERDIEATQIFHGYVPHASEQEQLAMKLYTEHLWNNTARMINLENFLGRVDHYMSTHQAHCLIINSFPDTEEIINLLNLSERYGHIDFAKGTLMRASLEEWENAPDTMQDLRINHLSDINHDILRNKVDLWIDSKKPVDLTEGLAKEILKGSAKI